MAQQQSEQQVVPFDLLLSAALANRSHLERLPHRTVKPNGNVYEYDQSHFPSRRGRKQRYAETLNKLGLRIGRLAGVTPIGKSQLANWASGRHIPTANNIRRIAPALEGVFGMPAEDWIAARELSRAMQRYNPNDGRPPRLKCGRGHPEPPGGWLAGNRCPSCNTACRARALAAARRRNAEKSCDNCGRIAVHQAGLCGSCYHRRIRYGDASEPTRREKLTMVQVRDIRKRDDRSAGWSKRLAAEFGVSTTTISNVVWNRTYRERDARTFDILLS
jgi:transcriptional regulator with XRE-family HTH domain